jgi:tetratricopeptide (TPR) repeat protein
VQPQERLAAAMRLLSSGAWYEAEVAACAALAQEPDDLQALLLQGLAIAAMGEAARSAPILNRVAAAAPDAIHPCVDFAALQPPLPRSLVARQFAACLGLAPQDDRLRLAYASFLLDTDRPAEVETILADGPDNAACHHLRGLAQAEQALFAAAIDSFRCAVALDPDAAASWSNLGMVLKVEGHFPQAIEAHDRAVALAPADPRLRVNRSVALLKAGAWRRAWADYEARLELTDTQLVDPVRLMRSLQPGDSLGGQTIVAQHEDGFGDTLQFLRYLPLLAARGARVVALVPPALDRVLRTVPGVEAVVSDARRLPPHDFVCPMFSLPRVFGTTVDTVPPVPVVAMEQVLVRQWAQRWPSGKLRVGLVWAGQDRPSLPGFGTLDRRRSCGLAGFAPLFDVDDTAFVSLQAGPAARQPRPEGVDLADPMPGVTDFADTAAIIAGLDVVVSVDTSVVHLAGLVGKPVFLLDRYDGCWRWLSGRDDSPWYPALRIFRQDRPGDWSGAMARAAAALQAMASGLGGKRQEASVA